MTEIIITIVILLVLYFWNRRYGRRLGFSLGEQMLLQGLCVYHLLFSVVFTRYLLENGGDAIRYWALEADLSQNPVNWIDYWGHGTFFLQWLHFWPSKVLGLEFWFGNVVYAAISWLGIREIFALVRPHLKNAENRLLRASGWLILFLPNLHFWSAGIGKEAWLLLGMAMVLQAFSTSKTNWLPLLMGLLLAFWVRPAFGIVLGATTFVFLMAARDLGMRTKGLVFLVGLLAGVIGVWKLSVMMHLEEISLASIMQFSDSQFDFLEGFQANSEIPMAEYSWPQKIWALFFRPMVWENGGFWHLAASLENSVGLLLTFLGLIATFVIPKPQLVRSVPKFLFVGAIVTLGMCIVYGLTLNNLGIIMRMKSTYMIYWYFLFWMLTVSGIKSIIAGRENR